MRKVIVFYLLTAMLLISACSKSEDEQNVPTGKITKNLQDWYSFDIENLAKQNG